MATSNWKTGEPVFTTDPITKKRIFNKNVKIGTVIATFDGKDNYDKTYPKGNEHTAVFGDAPATGGINVWDQNFVYSKVVGRHNIPCSGSGYNNALNYYVVNV